MLIIAYSRDERFLARVPFQFDLDPELVEMDRLLDDRKLVLRVTHDLLLSAPQAAWNGRPSTPVEVTLRSSVLRHLMGWSYDTTHEEIVGSAKWRWFCRIYDHSVPNHSTLRDREQLVQPASLHVLNNRLVGLGREQQVTQGRKLRTDGTVIETNIHYPTDSRLLFDSARVLGRLCGEARDLLHPHTPAEKQLFRNRSRRAQRLARHIAQRLRGTKGQKKTANQAQTPYRRLVRLVETVLVQVDEIERRLRRHKSQRALALADLLMQYVPLVRQVIAQTTRRVLEHQNVPAPQKIVSLFEPHTAIIQRGKTAPHETEFGHKLWYSEVDGGLISEYRILKGNPPEPRRWKPSLKNHQKLFHHPPEVATADRGVFSPENEQAARDAGIEYVALPHPGAKSQERQAYEAQPWFRAALRFRAGIEGRISGLKRARHLKRCPNRGETGVERWVGWGVITNNLVVIARRLARRHRSKRSPQ